MIKDNHEKPIVDDNILDTFEPQYENKELELTRNKLNDKIKELDQSNKQLILSNEKLEQANQIINKKADDLKASSKVQSRFLAMMSHEIRTPLNAIMGSARLLKDAESPEENRQYTEIIEISGNLLLGIINNVLDYSQIEAGMLNLLSSNFRLSDIVGNLKEILKKSAESKDLEFKLQTDSDLGIDIVGDDIRLQQIILNLGNNAIKYTQSGSIVLKIETQDITGDKVKCKFSIIDTGIGISEENINHLFKPFSQINTESNKGIEGTGLGLSIVKNTVELMGGKVEVESIQDVGSTFWVELTFQKQKIKKEERRISDFQRNKYVSIKNKLKILIADDFKFSCVILEKILKKSGITLIDIADNGLKAVALSKKNNYDIIFMDYLMPGLNGFEATAAIRKFKKNKKYTHIIALSADVMLESKKACINAGIDYFMVKPFSPDIINNVIREIIHKNVQ
jgi:signal transduction histidine kinase